MANKFIYARRRPIYVDEWLEAFGMSQAELARRMQTSEANIHRWKKEPWRVNVDVLSALADGFRFNIAMLFRRPESVLAPESLAQAKALHHLPELSDGDGAR